MPTISWHFIHQYAHLYARIINNHFHGYKHILIFHEQKDLEALKILSNNVSYNICRLLDFFKIEGFEYYDYTQYNQNYLSKSILSELKVRGSTREFADHQLLMHLNSYLYIFKTYSPNIHISEKPSSLSTNSSFTVADKLDIPFLSFSKIPIENKFNISTNYFGFPDFLENLPFTGNKNNPIDKNLYYSGRDFIEKFNHKPAKTKDIILKSIKPTLGWKFSKLFRFIVESISWFNNSRYYIFRHPIYYQVENLQRILRVFILNNFQIFDNFDFYKKTNYIYYPLHRIREWSMHSTASNIYGDELNFLKNLRDITPSWISLVIKEHTGFPGGRKFSFYKKIKNIGGITILSSKESNWKLMKNALFTITLSGTTGFETLLFRKRVFLFGRSWYENLIGIEKFKGWDSYTEFIDFCLKKRFLDDKEFKKLSNQVGFILKSSKNGYPLLNDKERLYDSENLSVLSKSIKDFLSMNE